MSLDFGLFAKLLVDSVNSKKEKYENMYFGTTVPAVKNTFYDFRIDTATIISIFLSLVLGVIAFILSWSCNTALGYHVVVKTVFGTFAFVFGFTYVVLYLLLRWDVCSKIMK